MHVVMHIMHSTFAAMCESILTCTFNCTLFSSTHDSPIQCSQPPHRKTHTQCNGAFVELQLRLPTERPVVDDHRAFVKFLSAAFSQRRKMLYNSLVPLYSTAEVTAALQETGLPENTRPQDLGLAQYVELYNTILARRRGAKGDTVAVGGT